MTRVETPEAAKRDPSYYKALTELLYQLADDDFLVSFRGSEWLGLAPHIEEDVSFTSITQNTMGHATLYYQLLEELGEGEQDALAHERSAAERRNAVYLEKKNGEGIYWEEPRYDWALAVIRNFLYESLKKVKLEALTKSSYELLALVAQKVLMEQPYHIAHWRIWVSQLMNAEEARSRLIPRLEEAWRECLDLVDLGPAGETMVAYGLIMDEASIKEEWLKAVAHQLPIPSTPLSKQRGSGRAGEHTSDLDQALETLAEVYETDRQATW